MRRWIKINCLKNILLNHSCLPVANYEYVIKTLKHNTFHIEKYTGTL